MKVVVVVVKVVLVVPLEWCCDGKVTGKVTGVVIMGEDTILITQDV